MTDSTPLLAEPHDELFDEDSLRLVFAPDPGQVKADQASESG